MKDYYLDFVDLKYKPDKTDLICKFYVEPARGITMKEAIGRVASESSNGTWTELTTLTPRIRKLAAKAYKIKGNNVEIAYPIELFEPGNMPQILSSIAGNIFGMKAVQNLRLQDINWPLPIIKSFLGPQFGINGIRSFMKIKKRPLTATVPKPKVGMTAEEHSKVCYDVWIGGVDLCKDDENLSSLKFNKFKKRVNLTFKMRDKAEKETGEKKSYLINISSETKEMIHRARMVANHGGEYVMIDILTTGWSSLQTLREECKHLGLAIHAHRCFHSLFTRNPKHGMSMLCVADIARLIGVDQLHIGTVLGKLVSPKEEVLMLEEELQKKFITKNSNRLEEDWYNIKPVLPAASGGLHPGIVPDIMKMLGNDIIIQCGGGIHGHPDGSKAGATALRQAIDATMNNISLEKAAKEHKELRNALKTWHHIHPK